VYFDNSIIYKHVFGHAYGILMIIDYYRFYPIRDNKLSILYGALALEFEWMMIFISLFEIPS